MMIRGMMCLCSCYEGISMALAFLRCLMANASHGIGCV